MMMQLKVLDLFRLEKEHKAIKDRIIRDVRNLFEYEEEDYCKPVRVDNVWSNSYIEYKSKGDRKTLSVEEYLDEIRPYLKHIINNLKIKSTIAIKLFFLKITMKSV